MGNNRILQIFPSAPCSSEDPPEIARAGLVLASDLELARRRSYQRSTDNHFQDLLHQTISSSAPLYIIGGTETALNLFERSMHFGFRAKLVYIENDNHLILSSNDVFRKYERDIIRTNIAGCKLTASDDSTYIAKIAIEHEELPNGVGISVDEIAEGILLMPRKFGEELPKLLYLFQDSTYFKMQSLCSFTFRDLLSMREVVVPFVMLSPFLLATALQDGGVRFAMVAIFTSVCGVLPSWACMYGASPYAGVGKITLCVFLMNLVLSAPSCVLVLLFELDIYLLCMVQLLVFLLVLVPGCCYCVYEIWGGLIFYQWWAGLVATLATVVGSNILIGVAFVGMVTNDVNWFLRGMFLALALYLPDGLTHSIPTFIYPRLLWQHSGPCISSPKSPLFAASQVINACSAVTEASRLMILICGIANADVDDGCWDVYLVLVVSLICNVPGRTHWFRVLIGLACRDYESLLDKIAPTVFLQHLIDYKPATTFLRYFPVIVITFSSGLFESTRSSAVIIVIVMAIVLQILEDYIVRNFSKSRLRAPVEYTFSKVWMLGSEMAEVDRSCVFHPYMLMLPIGCRLREDVPLPDFEYMLMDKIHWGSRVRGKRRPSNGKVHLNTKSDDEIFEMSPLIENAEPSPITGIVWYFTCLITFTFFELMLKQ